MQCTFVADFFSLCKNAIASIELMENDSLVDNTDGAGGISIVMAVDASLIEGLEATWRSWLAFALLKFRGSSSNNSVAGIKYPPLQC